MKKRYYVLPESDSAHCCFEASVMDRETPVTTRDGRQIREETCVCECFELEVAKRLAAMLNEQCSKMEASEDEQ